MNGHQELQAKPTPRQLSPTRKNNTDEQSPNTIIVDNQPKSAPRPTKTGNRLLFKELAVRPSFVAHLSSEQQKVINGLKLELTSEKQKSACLKDELSHAKAELDSLYLKFHELQQAHEETLKELEQERIKGEGLTKELESLKQESAVVTEVQEPTLTIAIEEPALIVETTQDIANEGSLSPSTSTSGEQENEEDGKKKKKPLFMSKKKEKTPKKETPPKDETDKEEQYKKSKGLFFKKRKDQGSASDTEAFKKPSKFQSFVDTKQRRNFKKVSKQEAYSSSPQMVDKSARKASKEDAELSPGRERPFEMNGRDDSTWLEEIPTKFGVVFGVKRGACTFPCECTCYKKKGSKDSGNVCAVCGHYPTMHEDLGRISDDDEEYDEILDDSEGYIDRQAEQAGIENHWILNYDDFSFIRLLGKGNSSTVYYGMYKNQEVAIKVLRLENHKKDLEDFKKEMQIMSELRSPHIIHFHGATFHPKQCIVLEYCPNGSLFHILQNNNYKVNWKIAIQWMIQTVRGINTLHLWKPQIVHRDLKSLNLLVDSNKKIKVCDFGLSRYVTADQDQNTLMKMRGTFAYIAPEVYHGKPFTSKADIYSIGIIIWEILTRLLYGKHSRPYGEYRYIRHDFQIVIQAASKGIRPTLPKQTPEQLREIYDRCVHENPENRPSCTELLDLLDIVKKTYEENKASWDALPNSQKPDQPQEQPQPTIEEQTLETQPVLEDNQERVLPEEGTPLDIEVQPEEDLTKKIDSEPPIVEASPPIKPIKQVIKDVDLTTESHQSEEESLDIEIRESLQELEENNSEDRTLIVQEDNQVEELANNILKDLESE